MAIDERKLKKELAELHFDVPYSVHDDRWTPYTLALDRVIDLIKNQPKVNEWIPVEERLPEFDCDSELYDFQLVTIENGDVCFGVYRNDDEEWLTRMNEGKSVYTNEHKVLAWMPLPKPYEKGVNEE